MTLFYTYMTTTIHTVLIPISDYYLVLTLLIYLPTFYTHLTHLSHYSIYPSIHLSSLLHSITTTLLIYLTSFYTHLTPVPHYTVLLHSITLSKSLLTISILPYTTTLSLLSIYSTDTLITFYIQLQPYIHL